MVSAGFLLPCEESNVPSGLCSEEEVLSACSRAVWKAGGVPLLLPPLNDEKLMAATLARANGWLLSGLHEGCEEKRQNTALIHFGLQHAMKKGIPILACGKACECLASFWGVEKEEKGAEAGGVEHQQPLPKNQPFHPIALRKGSWLETCLGHGQLMVNSMHRATCWQSNEEALISATALDGTTEALEGRKGKVVGLRWNPEFLLESVPCQTLIFRNFVSLARQHRR